MNRARVNDNVNLNEWKGICVIGEQREGKIMSVTYELLGEACKLAHKKNISVTLVICGNQMEDALEAVAHYGADKIVYYEHEFLQVYSTDTYTKVLSEYIKKEKPETVIIGATTFGRDLAPRLAARLGTGLTADCTMLDIDENDGKMLQTRPAFGGNLMATIICPKNRPQMSTVRPGVMKKALKVDRHSVIDRRIPEFTQEDILTKVVEIVKEKKKAVSLQDAEIIVSGGRGVGNADNFKLLEELAEVLGGEVASSRAPVDRGWIGSEHQVGQTGTTVRPKLYIACGISGAIQHLAGMQEAECIVAINNNPNAPIFKIAHYGIVDDMFKVIPKLIEQLK